MQSIRLKNLRSFLDTKEIPINDINIFVGQNSSGKSTFLRTFPLLKQSVLRDTRGPILWYDDSLVDFGSYEEARNRYAKDSDGIHFCFKVRLNTYSRRYFFYDSLNLEKEVDVDIEIEVLEQNRKNYIGYISVYIENQTIKIEANSSGNVKALYVNDRSMSFNEGAHKLVKFDSMGLLPQLIFLSKNDKHVNREYYSNQCKDIIKSIIGNKLKNEHRIVRMISDLSIGSKEHILKSLKHDSSILTWEKKIKKWTIKTEQFREINDLIIANYVPSLLKEIDDKLRTYFDECKYIAPIRAKAVRYYRRQDLSVSEIDAYGDNLHMFIDNLKKSQMADYQNFVKEVFDFIPSAESSKGQITINITDSKGEKFNITDLGFGYSQILPIITKLWYSFSHKNNKRSPWDNHNKTITLLIEQPELHLHPAMQAQLADAFIIATEYAKKNDITLKLIIETHSPVIINRIGRRIIEKKIDYKKVNVMLFQLDNSLKNTTIKSTNFNENGVLLNWPLGFFEPEN